MIVNVQYSVNIQNHIVNRSHCIIKMTYKSAGKVAILA
jgi:hypothetical protein